MFFDFLHLPADLSPVTLALLIGSAVLAGFVDAVAGGGGLIQLPALLAFCPGMAPAVMFGTNKLASIVGTSAATVQYARRVTMPWRILAPAAALALAGSFFGAWLVTRLPPDFLRRMVPFILVAVLADTLRQKHLGRDHAPRLSPQIALLVAAATGLGIGFYDGFFGPGTGSFLVFAFVRVFGFDFLHASASAKFINLATNAAALAWFIPSGNFLLGLGLLMAAGNLGGALIGSRLAIAKGNRFVRRLFLVVVCSLLARMVWVAYVRP
jgi:uncharacterized membrane protein YfcA